MAEHDEEAGEMSKTKLYGKDLAEYEDINIEELLQTLTEAEIEELGLELIDPDDSMVPPSQRCAYRTTKLPTGPFNRKQLHDFLETKAKEEKDWDEAKPYTKETRGKIWKPKEVEKIVINEDERVDTEWDDVLAEATEEELVDLAAILGFHGMLNQVQYHKAFIIGNPDDPVPESDEDEDEDEDKPKEKKVSGFSGVAKHQEFKLVKDEPPNNTDVKESLKSLQLNKPEMKELNLNNIKHISLETLKEFGESLKKNTHLESFSLSNTRATEGVAKVFAESLKENKTLKTLNMESNYIGGDGIVELLNSIAVNQTLVEIRLANQRPATLGSKTEMSIANCIQYNYTLLRLGIFLEVPDARVRVQQYLQRNSDALRSVRMGQPLPEREKPAEAVKVKKGWREREAEERDALAADSD